MLILRDKTTPYYKILKVELWKIKFSIIFITHFKAKAKYTNFQPRNPKIPSKASIFSNAFPDISADIFRLLDLPHFKLFRPHFAFYFCGAELLGHTYIANILHISHVWVAG